MKLNLNEEEINESEAIIRLAKERLKKRREKEAEEEEVERDNDQALGNILILGFLGITFYKIMTGTF